MLWVLKRIISLRQFFWAPKNYIITDGFIILCLKIVFILTYAYTIQILCHQTGMEDFIHGKKRNDVFI